MVSPYRGLEPPYDLPSNIVYFHDWRYVNTGGFAWLGPNKENVPMWGTGSVPHMHLEHHDMPLGIRLVAQPARKSEPFLVPEKTQEIFLSGGIVIHEEGRYRLWYDSWPRGDIGTERVEGPRSVIKYAESDNGFDWKFPSLGLIECNGNRNNNIVYGPPLTSQTGYADGCVFKDPSAPPDERYKAFHLGEVSPRVLAKYLKERPSEVDPFYRRYPRGLFGAVSPDGLRWTPLPDPLVLQPSDTRNVCTYDTARKKYVAYCRTWFFNRRTIGRMETDNFRSFPLAEDLFWPNAMMEPYNLWYANSKTMMPGTVNYHLMFPLRWNLPEDKFDFYLATSPDGIIWGFVPGGPVCQPGPRGSWDGGTVVPGVGLVPLPNDRMGVILCGTPVPHKYPRRPPLGAFGWAWWEKGRLVALQAPLEGFFALWPLLFKGRTIHLNMRTAIAGYIQVEALGPDEKVLPGRGFNDCDYLNGDHIDHIVTWHGEPDIGHPESAPVTFRFKLRSAELFSVEFR